MRHFGDNGIAVILRVASDDDFRALVANSGVGGIFQMLIGDAAVVVEDFVVPFAFEVHLRFNKIGKIIPTWSI